MLCFDFYGYKITNQKGRKQEYNDLYNPFKAYSKVNSLIFSTF